MASSISRRTTGILEYNNGALGILDYRVIGRYRGEKSIASWRLGMHRANKALGKTAPAVIHWACDVLQPTETTYTGMEDSCFTDVQGCAKRNEESAKYILYQNKVVEINSQVQTCSI